jgi:uncharacterized membrane protein
MDISYVLIKVLISFLMDVFGLTLFFFMYAKNKTATILNRTLSRELAKKIPLETSMIEELLKKKSEWLKYQGDIHKRNMSYMYLAYGIVCVSIICTSYLCWYLQPKGLKEILITAAILMIIVFIVQYFIFTKVALYYNPILKNELLEMVMKIIDQKALE